MYDLNQEYLHIAQDTTSYHSERWLVVVILWWVKQGDIFCFELSSFCELWGCSLPTSTCSNNSNLKYVKTIDCAYSDMAGSECRYSAIYQA